MNNAIALTYNIIMIKVAYIIIALIFSQIFCTFPVTAENLWTVLKSDPKLYLENVQFFNSYQAYGHDMRCLWTTKNGGQYWQSQYCASVEKKSEPSDKIIDFHFINPQNGWLLIDGENSRLLHTTDEGNTWQEHIFQEDLHFVSVRFYDTLIGWLIGEKFLSPNIPDVRGIIYVTKDGGTTWDECSTEIAVDYRWRLEDVWIFSATEVLVIGDFILRSIDGGKTWSEISNSPSVLNLFSDLRNHAIQFFNHSIGWILRIPAENYLLTFDGGRTWMIRYPPTIGLHTMDTLIYLTANEVWTTFGGIYHSKDGGETWEIELEPDKNGYSFYTLSYLPDKRQLIATGDGVVAFRSIENAEQSLTPELEGRAKKLVAVFRGWWSPALQAR